uniref:Cyclic nucleotide-binding domain-containing protein n=1 Tax=Heliothis virescens TaxID=7102 RepID=A0A2A4K7A7_HELVI
MLITMRKSRRLLFFSEQVLVSALVLHASTCMWYALNRSPEMDHSWYNLGYPPHVQSRNIKFDSYRSCWYYCTCRFFNVVFGDSFPMYHHMISYLKFSKAPSWLVDQCKNYKLQLWKMKAGILRSHHLQKMPLPLQMELIFDINVGNFHNSMLFRETKESFMRQISLLMRHELYLAGQHIWSQGVVKSGMICIKRGVIEMLSDEDDESPMIAFKDGTVLGELSLFYSIPSKVTVKAATYVELQVLRRTDFMRVIAEHPSMFELIRQKISDRLKSSRTRQEAIEKYDKGDSRLIRTRYRPMKVLKDRLAGVEEEDPTFVDDSHMYYRDENNERQPKFTSEYLELYQMSSNVTTIDAPHICLTSNFPWILIPDTDFTRMFDVIHFLMVLYVCFMTPYAALQTFHSDTETVLSTIVVAGLLLNIYIQLTTATSEKNERKETVKEIAEVKMASFGFYLDVISVFPVSIFSDTLDPQGETVAGQIAMLFPILQVWHLWDYINKWARNFNSQVKILTLIKFGLIFIIFSYWSGCLLYLYACPRKLCRENTWMSQLIYWETKVFMTNEARHERPMKTSFLFGTSVFTGFGSSEVAPGDEDLLLTVLLFVLGTYLSVFYTAKICSIYLLSTQRKLKFKESMRELFYFLSVNHVSGKIKARVKKFFCVQWYYNNAVSTEEIFENMSTNIQQEVLSIEMVETLRFCPLFQVHNRDFLQTVASNTRKLVLPDNEVVQHAADIGRDMYILKKGHCNLLNHYGKRQMTIGPGTHFGVVEMLFGLPKVYTVVTSTNCILLHVEYSALVQCWGTFPDISHPIITALEDPELKAKAAAYEDAKPLTGRMDVKTNRIAQEIKESFVLLTTREARAHYVKTFDKLGVLRHLRYIFMPGCITPHGMFLKFWCGVRFLVALCYIFFVPYDIATKQHKHGGIYNWSDVILYLDIVIMAYVAYYNEKSLLVTHPLLTVSRYLKHSFLLDIISVFPLEEVFRIVNDNSDMDLYRLNRMLLVTRITGAFAYWESDIMRVNPAIVLVKFLPIAVTIINFVTAFIFVNACKPYLPPDSHFIMVNCTKIFIISSVKQETRYAITEYVYTFYWVYEIFAGLGCTPISMPNSADFWLMMALQITGFMYFAFMFGYVASTRSTAAQALLEHNEKTRDLANFLYQQNVDPMLTVKSLKYFEYVWMRTNGSNPQKICRRLNSALMEDTLVFMYERALREVPLFGKVERSFIRVITQHLTEMYLLKGDTVIQCRDIQPYIYIIYRGKVDVLTSYNEMITCMGPGGMFGNFTGQPISCSEVTIYASRSLDLLVIPSVTFFNLIKYYPKIQEPLNKAFEMSRDYILPINMEMDDDESSDDDSTFDLSSMESGADSRSGSSRFDISGPVPMSVSQSNVSQSKSSASVSTFHSYSHASNLLRPGTLMFQSYGYLSCTVVTLYYVIGLYDLVTLNDCYVFYWIHALLDVYFYAKIYLTMHQGYVSKHGELILEGPKCRHRYFKHKVWVCSDIVANFPLEFLGFCFP